MQHFPIFVAESNTTINTRFRVHLRARHRGTLGLQGIFFKETKIKIVLLFFYIFSQFFVKNLK